MGASKSNKLDVYIGPCVLESEALAFQIAEQLKNDLAPWSHKINLHFKGSFDKANRTSIDSYRGPGLEAGLKILEKINKQLQLPTLTDFHSVEQALPVAEVVDVLQLPAFLCRQTDMVAAGASACKRFNRQLKIKKGQFLSPWETENIVTKAHTFLPLENIILTERGTSFGYNNLIVDMASFKIMQSFGVRAVHDATHCVQQPGGLGKSTGGKRDQIRVLARAAIAAGADGVFMETHPNPDKALSDSSTSLPLNQIKDIVKELVTLWEVVRAF